jgi:hypothetical protein
MVAVPTLTLAEMPQLEALFAGMEPTDLAGQPFTPSLHPEDTFLLEDVPPEPEDDDEIVSLGDAQLGSFQLFTGSEVPLPLIAIDAGVVDIGISRTGFALAFKAAIVTQDIDGTHSVTKIGPRVKFIAPDNRAELLRFIGRELMNEEMFVTIQDGGSADIKKGSTEPNQYKDRLRNFIERMLQLQVLRQLTNGLLLIDGALTLRTFNTPEEFMDELGRKAAQHNSDIVGVSKKSRITVGGVHMSALLDEADAQPDAGFRRILAGDLIEGEDEVVTRNLGAPFAVRFAPGGFTFRVDVARRSLLSSEEEILQALYGNTQMTLGYPNLLRLAHIHSAFTKAEIVSLQVQAAHDYRVSMRPPEDLSVIFAPFRKGLGG